MEHFGMTSTKRCWERHSLQSHQSAELVRWISLVWLLLLPSCCFYWPEVPGNDLGVISIMCPIVFSDPITVWPMDLDLGLSKELQGKEIKFLFIRKTCTTFSETSLTWISVNQDKHLNEMYINQFNPLLKTIYSDLSMQAENSACTDYNGLNVYLEVCTHLN